MAPSTALVGEEGSAASCDPEAIEVRRRIRERIATAGRRGDRTGRRRRTGSTAAALAGGGWITPGS